MRMNFTWGGIAAAVIILLMIFRGFRRGFVKEIISAFSLVLTIGIVWVINPYVNQFLQENTGIYEQIQGAMTDFVENHANNSTAVGSSEQAGILDQLNLPEVLTSELEKNNTAETYAEMGVRTFLEYISEYLAEMVMSIVSFLLSYAQAFILIRALGYLLNIFTHVPGIKQVNKAAGGLIGGLKSILLIWILFLVITILCNTPFGENALGMIQQDRILSFLYQNNLILRYFAGMW